eukprot:6883666-Prymnesium_polylepis.1
MSSSSRGSGEREGYIRATVYGTTVTYNVKPYKLWICDAHSLPPRPGLEPDPGHPGRARAQLCRQRVCASSARR